MSVIVRRKLPHGKVPLINLRDGNVRDVVMKLNENIEVLQRQITNLQDVVFDLQNRK